MNLSVRPVFALALLAFVGSASAVPYGAFDPRSLGMGGAGVATGTSGNAVFLNPGLLASGDRNRFSLALPVGARVSDPDELLDALDDFSDANPVNRFRLAIDAYASAPDSNSAAEVEASGQALIGHLRQVSDKSLQAEGLAALVVGVPGERLSVSAFVNGYVLGGTVARVNEGDLDAIQATIAQADGIDAITDPTGAFSSAVDARFAAVVETGVSFATRFDALGGIAVGVTPKYVQVRTYDYGFVGSELDDVDIDLDEGERSENSFNADLGLAKDWGNGWMTGLSVRNVVSREYRTVRGNVLKIEPQPRLGIARRGERLTLAADLDLSESEPAGFASKSRYAIVGAEIDLFRTVQFRAGYRHNLASLPAGHEKGLISAGLGLSPFGVMIDAAVAGNSDELGAAVQLGFRF